MRSSISSSRWAFVTNTCAAAVLYLSVYGAVVTRFFPTGGEAQDQWQENQMRAEQYVEHARDYTVVITGSSLAARVPNDALPEGFHNLALAASGALTGLEIVARSSPAPRLVLVEVNNTLFREVDEPLLHRLFQPINARLRAWFPVLGDAYQPVGIACRIIRERVGFGPSFADVPVPPRVYDELFGLQKQYHARVPKPKELAAMLDALEDVLHRVQARGGRIAFFEMPVAPALDDSPLSTAIRAALATRFPRGRYAWLPHANVHAYETRDGRHLRTASARQFATFLAREVNRLADEGVGQADPSSAVR